MSDLPLHGIMKSGPDIVMVALHSITHMILSDSHLAQEVTKGVLEDPHLQVTSLLTLLGGLIILHKFG